MPLQTFLITKAIRLLEVYFSVNKHIISYLCLMSSDGATWKHGNVACTCVSVCPDYPSYFVRINETVTCRDSRSYATPVQSFPNLFWQWPAFHSLMQLKHHYLYIVCWNMIIIGVALFLCKGLTYSCKTNVCTPAPHTHTCARTHTHTHTAIVSRISLSET